MAYPIAWRGYFLDALTKKNSIYSQGLVSVAMAPDEMKVGELSERWYNDDLESFVSDTVVAAATTDISPAAITSDVEKHAVIQIGFGMKETAFEAMRKGQESINGFGVQLAQYVQRADQDYFNSILKGVFDSGGSGALYSTHYADNTANAVGGDRINSVAFDLLGEAGEDLNTVVMHSNHYKKIMNTMTWTNAQDFGLPNAGSVPTLNGRRVVINDTICATQDSGTSYPIFIMGGEPLFTDYHENLRIVEDFDGSKGGGQNELYVYRMAKFGVKGVGWATTTAPTSTSDYETATNYTKKLDNKQILLLRSDFAA